MENPAHGQLVKARTPFLFSSPQGQITLELLWIVIFFLSFVTAVYWLWDESHRQLQTHQFPLQNSQGRPR